jgi:hypothetical protein
MRVFLTVPTLLFTTCALAHGGAIVTTTEDVKVNGTPQIVVENSGGAVSLTAGPAGVVHVIEERHADSEADARAILVTASFENGRVLVRWRDDHHSNNRSVAFRVTAPAGCSLSLHTGGGAVTVGGFTGGVEAHTGGGAIDIEDMRGRVQAHSGGGGIVVKHITGTVEADTGGGAIAVDGTLSGSNHLSTGGGPITVSIPATSKLKVEALTSGGPAHNAFGLSGGGWPISDRFSGNIGDGSAGSLEMRSGGGPIKLRKSN